MVASYLSARFEKTILSNGLRCIVRNKDDGGVPPVPSPSYFPTSPDSLREFLVLEYINDTLGERMARVATLADIAGLPVRTLNAFEVPSANFTAAGVVSGDVLELFPPANETWLSEEYPSTPFLFNITGVPSSTTLTLARPIPSFLPNLSWLVRTRTSGDLNGFPRRTGFPVPGMFLDQRMNLPFNDVPTLDAFVAATKASIDALGATSTSSTLSSENYSSRS